MRNSTMPLNLQILEAEYQVSPDGTIQYQLRTNPAIHADHYNLNPSFFQYPYICIGDMYFVEVEDNGNIKWGNLMHRHPSAKDPRNQIQIAALQACPICGTPVVQSTALHRFCPNAICPAKLFASLQKYLISCGVHFSGEERRLLGVLTETIVKHPADLFTLTTTDLSSARAPTRFVDINELYQKIQDIRQRMTLGQFLATLNYPASVQVEHFWIDIEQFDTHITNVDSFIGWVNAVQQQTATPEPIMSAPFYQFVYTYVSSEHNRLGLFQMERMEVFRKY